MNEAPQVYIIFHKLYLLDRLGTPLGIAIGDLSEPIGDPSIPFLEIEELGTLLLPRRGG